MKGFDMNDLANSYPSDPRFGVGPSLIPKEHLENLLKLSPDILGTSHRQKSVVKLFEEVHQQLKDYFELPQDWKILIGNGGASFFFDMAAIGLTKSHSHHLVCGEFSHKWQQAHELAPFLQVTTDKKLPGEGLDLNWHAPKGVDHLCATLNETSTGVRLGDFHFEGNRPSDLIISLDATSGAGQMPFDKKYWQEIDCYFFGPQKVFASDGGTFIAFLSPRAQLRVEEILKSGRYIPSMMNLKKHIEMGEIFQTLNTPSVITVALLREQLAVMQKLGKKAVDELTLKRSQLLYQWAENHHRLKPFVSEARFRSPVVATLEVDPEFDLKVLTQKWRQEKRVYDIDGYRKIGGNQLRISLFHHITLENLQKLMTMIDKELA
jgi:phosphoserine aminotransferase